MDYSVDLYPKIPFYMTYPMQNMYLTEMEYEKDIMKLVEERLDELAYEGSRIYDEEPDRMMIQMEIDRLYQKLLEQQKEPDQAVPSYFEMVPMALAGQQRRPPQRDCRDDWLCSMVGVLFGTELYRRRWW